MSCYRPLTAWRGPLQPSGKRSVVFKPSESTGGLSAFPQKLPCGQCIGCRLDYSLDWATRCIHEAQLHEKNCFITLTYNDLNLPKDGGLQLKDWQLFMKRLRKEIECPIKFYHAGEYGDQYLRPHYHALIFGYDFPDRKYLKKTPSGMRIDSSSMLSGLWQQGYASVGNVTFESAAYVARYCMKKVLGKGKDVQDAQGLKPYERMDSRTGAVLCVRPEYVVMSRGGRTSRGGIAADWIRKFESDVFPRDYVVVRGGKKMPPPRYYDSQYELKNPVDLERIKLHRISRCSKKEEVWNDFLRKYQTLDANRDERLAVMELVKTQQVSLLKSGLESGQ